MLGSFRGVRFGMDHAKAIEVLKRDAARRGVPIEVIVHADMEGGTPSTYLKEPGWTLSLPEQGWCVVSGTLRYYRDSPLPLSEALAWVRERLSEYGAPAHLAVGRHRREAPITITLRWRDAMGTSLGLAFRDDGWMVREEREENPLVEQTYPFREPPHPLDRYLARLHAARNAAPWVARLAEAVAALNALAPRAELRADMLGVTYAERIASWIAEEPAYDGVFVRSARANELRSALVEMASVANLSWLGLSHGATIAQVDWVGGLAAARLVREDLADALRAANAEVLPAILGKTVEGAIAEWLPVVRPPSARTHKYFPDRWPLRLTDPRTGRVVQLDNAGSRDELLAYAHALLAADLAFAPTMQ